MIYDDLKKVNNFIALKSTAIGTDTDTVGEEIPFTNYESLFFAIAAESITDGTFTPKIEVQRKSDDGWEVPPVDKLNGYPADGDKILAATLVLADSGKTSKIGVYNVADIYKAARLTIVSTATTVGGTIAAQAILGHARAQQCFTQKPV